MRNLFLKCVDNSVVVGVILVFIFTCTRSNAQTPASCGAMGVEGGWGTWVAATGTHTSNGNSSVVSFTATNLTPTAPRFNLTSGAGTDACTSAGNPAVPVVAPGFGNASIQLGQPSTPGGDPASCPSSGCAEQLTYKLKVTAADTNFIYAYAIFFDFPAPGGTAHTGAEVPFAEIDILDQNGKSVPCSHQKYMGDTAGQTTQQPGFYPNTCTGAGAGGGNNGALYKPWTTVGVNLSKYVGQVLTVNIVNADCAPKGHYCHSYWDFACPPVSSSSTPFCLGETTTMAGPVSNLVSNQYSYQWYINTKPYNPTNHWTIIPGATGVNYSVAPLPGDTFALKVIQSSGCDFWIPFVPQIKTITADFALVDNCGTVTFTDVSPPPNTGTITNWNWNFPGGNPSTSTSQSVVVTYPTSGTHTATLNITSSEGCVASKTLTVTTGGPVPLFVSKNVCFNNKTIFTDQSSGATQYAWDFGDGSSSTQQNPTHTYGTTGTFSVTLSVANAFGCKAMLPLITVVNPLPVAGFSTLPVCIGNPTCFKDGSTVTPGTVIGWSWNFDDPGSGAANTSSLQNPCHTYKGTGPFTVILTATSDSGCQNTITLPASTNPPPIASIIPRNVCFNSSTTFTDASTSPAGPANAINAWDWNFGDGTANSSQQNPSHLYSAAGTYTITLIVTTVNGCKDTTHNKVVIYHPPVPSFGQPTTGCSPVYANYTDLSASADGTVNKWQWSFPGGSPLTSTVQNPSKILYANPGSYSVSLIVTTTNGCTDSIKLPMVEVYGWPTADFCVAPSIAPSTEPVFTFCDMWSKDVSRWTWDFGDNSAIDTINTTPVHSYSATANNNDFYKYNICIRVETKHGCWATACHSVELIPEFTFYIPNTFTPNGDGTNEMFYGKCRGVKEYNIWVFDRWGNQVWDCHHDDKNTNWDSGLTTPQQEGLASYCQWDGKVVNGGMDMSGNSGQLAQQDVYVWKVSLLDIFNKRHMYIGHVNIVR